MEKSAGARMKESLDVLNQNIGSKFLPWYIAIALIAVFNDPNLLSHAMGGLSTLFSMGLTVITLLIYYYLYQLVYGTIKNPTAPVEYDNGNLLTYFLTVILMAFFCFFGFLLLVLPGIYMIFIWYFAAISAAIGKVDGPMNALKFSSSLVKGRFWDVFGAIAAATIPVTIVAVLQYGAGAAGFMVIRIILTPGVAYAGLWLTIYSLKLLEELQAHPAPQEPKMIQDQPPRA